MTHDPRVQTKIFVNGKIWTNDRRQEEATAMAVQGGRIVAAGDESTVQPFKNLKDVQIIDLNGKRVLPGFNDAHVHFMQGGFHLLGVDLRKAKTRDEFRTLIQEYASNLPKGRWITGGNWDHEVWPEKQWPSKEVIDDVTPDHPVMVQRLDMHVALANSRALKLSGITKDTPDPFGGTIHRDPKTGEPSGILIDNAADLVYGVIPEPTAEERLHAARTAQDHALSFGVTSLQDILTSERDLRTYLNLYETGELKVRLYVYRPISFRSQLAEIGMRRAFGNAWLRIGGVKAFTDGSMGARSALFYEPYNDNPSTSGLALQSKEDLMNMILEADASGLQIALHAIGDKANTWALNAFEAARKRNGNWDRRHRIEHAQVVLPTDLPRFVELGVIASLQPSHCIDDMRWAESCIGDRARHAYLVKSFVDHQTKIALGTDWTVETLNPMLGLYAAVTRESPEGSPPGGWFPDERITLEQAIEYYTLGSAYAEFAEHEKGRLTPGNLADFVVLDRDIFRVAPKELLETNVLMTVVGGEVMFEQREGSGNGQ